MLKFFRSVSDSWITNRTTVAAAYYSKRLHFPYTWQAVAQIHTPFGTRIKVPLQDSDANRQTCATFSDGNAWNSFSPLSEVKTIVDLGANRGHTSLYWKARFPDAAIHSIEMDSSNCKACEALLRFNSIQGNVWNIAICEQDGMLRYRTHAANTRHRLEVLADHDETYDYNEQRIAVEGLTFKSFLDSKGIEQVDILKVDIEGAEQFLLNTCDQWSERVTNLILEIHHNIDTKLAQQTLLDAGFDISIGDERNRLEWWCSRK